MKPLVLLASSTCFLWSIAPANVKVLFYQKSFKFHLKRRKNEIWMHTHTHTYSFPLKKPISHEDSKPMERLHV